MEEVINEIRQAEEKANALILQAEEKARKIAAKLEEELDEIKNAYETKLKDDSQKVLASTIEAVNGLKEEEAKASTAKANGITDSARGKIDACVDMVYGFIVKEFTE